MFRTDCRKLTAGVVYSFPTHAWQITDVETPYSRYRYHRLPVLERLAQTHGETSLLGIQFEKLKQPLAASYQRSLRARQSTIRNDKLRDP